MGSKDGFTTMKSHLQALQDEDPEAIFIARRINKLGFESDEVLKEHFSTYGEVKGIHVCHSRVKSGNTRDAGGDEFRKRPAALGFVVMETAEAAKRILEAGPEIEVKDVKVLVQPFNRNHGAEGEASSGGATQGGGPQKRARTDGAAVPKKRPQPQGARGTALRPGDPGWSPYVYDDEARELQLDERGSSRPSWLRDDHARHGQAPPHGSGQAAYYARYGPPPPDHYAAAHGRPP